MQKLIDAHELWAQIYVLSVKHRWRDRTNIAFNKCLDTIQFFPPVDAVEVVRCKDCKKYIPCQKLPIGTSKWCDLFDRATCEMNYCGWGKKREKMP